MMIARYWFSVLMLTALSAVTNAEADCPFEDGVWQAKYESMVQALGLTTEDLLTGRLLDQNNYESLVTACHHKHYVLAKIDDVESELAKCRFVETGPRAPVLQLAGLKKAVTLICKHVQLVNVTEPCIEERREKFVQCLDAGYQRSERFLQHQIDNSTLADYCGKQRVVGFCVDEVFGDECGSYATLHRQVMYHLHPERCSCLQTKRELAKASPCLTLAATCWEMKEPGGQAGTVSLTVETVVKSVLFGAVSVDIIAAMCERGAGDDRYMLVSKLKHHCLQIGESRKRCLYHIQFYEEQQISYQGLLDAATYMCDNKHEFLNTSVQSCVNVAASAAETCRTRQREYNATDYISREVCRDAWQTEYCIADYFRHCGQGALDTVREIARLRLPRVCQCRLIGYDPNGATSTRPTLLLMVLMMLLLCLGWKC